MNAEAKDISTITSSSEDSFLLGCSTNGASNSFVKDSAICI